MRRIMMCMSAVFLLWGSSFSAHAGQLKELFGCEEAAGVPCLIFNNPGGVVSQFRDAASQAQQLRIPIVIDGYCISACTLFADQVPRRQLCVTARAVFAFHKGRARLAGTDGDTPRPRYYSDIVYSPPVLQWITAQGGLPYDDLLLMAPRDVQRFWKVCPS